MTSVPHSNSGNVRADSLDVEHRELVAWVVDLRRAAEESPRDGKPLAWTKERQEGFRRLLARLADHFSREEAAEGLYSRLLNHRPGLSHEVQLLRDQHRIFNTWGRDLLGEAGREAPDTLGIAEGLRSFLDHLGRHESRERELDAETGAARAPGGE